MDEDTGLLRASVAYPFEGEGSRTRLLFGTGLHFLAGVVAAGVGAAAVTFAMPGSVPAWPVALLVAALAYVPLLGYTATTVRALLDDEPAPPGFADWGALLRDGRRYAAVALLYAVPLAALGALTAVASPEGGTAALAAGAAAGLYALVALYVLPAALVTVVDEGALGAAWSAGRLREAVADGRYLARWLFGVAVVLVGGTVGAALAPFVAGFAVLFATHLAALYAVTQGVVLSLDLTLEDPPPAPASGYVPGWEDGPSRQELSDGRLGGSLLPTRPGEDDGGSVDTDGRPPTPGSLATTGDGEDGPTDLDRPGGGPAVGAGGSGSGGSSGGSSSGEAAATESGEAGKADPGSDIAPYESERDEMEPADED